jgi:predicted nucleic acid-binding protein
VRLVVADTGPVNYLVLIGQIDLLPALFESIVIPATVRSELASLKAPPSVRHWNTNPPAWLEVRGAPLDQAEDARLKGIDEGEKAAIQLALSLHADLLLMDDRRGVSAALGKGLRVTGTLGILDLSARRGLIDFAQAIRELRQTTFRIPDTLLDSLLRKHAQEGGDG